jgi:hypothetical protein
MANKDEAADFERRNTDPTVPIDGADPKNMAGPYSNVELEIAANKLHPPVGDGESIRLRPAFAKQAAETGDAITDSDVLANPAAGLNVAEDNGQQERQERDEELGVAGLTSTPAKSAPARKSTPATAKDKA